MSQFSVSVVSPVQAAPPFADWVASVLERVLVPPPQVAEHSVHSLKWPHVQSTVTCHSNDTNKNNIISLTITKLPEIIIEIVIITEIVMRLVHNNKCGILL